MGKSSTSFKPGNKEWLKRTRSGIKPKYETPEALLEKCIEYLEWVEDNPIMIAEAVKHQGIGTLMEVPVRRPPLMAGLWSHLGIVATTWGGYKQNPEMLEVIIEVETRIRSAKLEGAMANQFNQNIIARDLGMTEKKETTHNIDESLQDLLYEIGEKQSDL